MSNHQMSSLGLTLNPLSAQRPESILTTKPSPPKPRKSFQNGIPTDWIIIHQQGVLDSQLEDEDEWDMCSELEKLHAKEGLKTWNQSHREKMLDMGERSKGLTSEKLPEKVIVDEKINEKLEVENRIDENGLEGLSVDEQIKQLRAAMVIKMRHERNLARDRAASAVTGI